MSKENKKTEEKEEIIENEAATVEAETSKEIEELKKQSAELNDKLLRTLAEYDNFRKRSQKEKESIFMDSKADIIGKLLPVIDNFERAAAVTNADLESYKKGVEMTVTQLLEVLSSLGTEAFGKAGEDFDPNIHNGVMHIEDDELPENVIAEVFMKGYKIGDRVVRHATVKVAN